MAQVHPQTVQQHRYLPDLGRYRTLVMRAMEYGGGGRGHGRRPASGSRQEGRGQRDADDQNAHKTPLPFVGTVVGYVQLYRERRGGGSKRRAPREKSDERPRVLADPALSTRGNLGPWSAPVARVHPRTVQQHRYLPDLGSYRTLVMRAME